MTYCACVGCSIPINYANDHWMGGGGAVLALLQQDARGILQSLASKDKSLATSAQGRF